jgi:hypothetical protein
MCYFLYIATPLTLSEVRSMLPPGLTADPAGPSEARTIKQLHPAASTIALLLVGSCSCDLVRQRLADSREDERHLRVRLRQARLGRPQVIAALERHRRAAARPPSESSPGWPSTLAAFVVEHARNAGPTLYLLTFSRFSREALASCARIACTAGEVLLRPADWLPEGRLVIVQ